MKDNWKEEFDNKFTCKPKSKVIRNVGIKMPGYYVTTEAGPQDIMDFISQLLSSQKAELMKIIDKLDQDNDDGRFYTKEDDGPAMKRGFTNAILHIKAEVEEL